MTNLLLQPTPARGPNDYEVIADDWIVGRIVLSDASPAERPWMWSLDHAFHKDREPTQGYEATREAAMAARRLSICCCAVITVASAVREPSPARTSPAKAAVSPASVGDGTGGPTENCDVIAAIAAALRLAERLTSSLAASKLDVSINGGASSKVPRRRGRALRDAATFFFRSLVVAFFLRTRAI